jgi:FkbM family methyltransferase
MHYDYIDIGTSNWGTSCNYITETNKPQILLVEPVKDYLDQLPSGDHITKCRAAIGAQDKTTEVYYIPESVINEHLSEWGFLVGCNSVGDYHPSQRDALVTRKKLSLDLVQIDPVEMITFQELCRRHCVESIGHVKIDTEGYEVYILPSVLKMVQPPIGLAIESIEFEYAFSNPEQQAQLNQMVEEFLLLGYEKYWVPNLDGTPGSNDMGLKKIHK